jgi:hypothetical protein
LVVVEAELEAMREEEAAQRAVEEELARIERLDRCMDIHLDSLVTNAIGEKGDLRLLAGSRRVIVPSTAENQASHMSCRPPVSSRPLPSL